MAKKTGSRVVYNKEGNIATQVFIIDLVKE